MRGRIHEVALLPAEIVAEQPPQIGRAPAGCGALALFFQQLAEIAPPARDVAVGDDLGVRHDRGRNDEADRLDEAEPFLVREDQAAPFAVRHGLSRPRPEIDDAKRVDAGCTDGVSVGYAPRLGCQFVLDRLEPPLPGAAVRFTLALLGRIEIERHLPVVGAGRLGDPLVPAFE